jgi:hypothetical protein
MDSLFTAAEVFIVRFAILAATAISAYQFLRHKLRR